MAIRPFLAMTAAEMAENPVFPENTAWMACHFSPYGTGLCNLPVSLPPESLLILNDRTPIFGHDPRLIARQLGACVETLGCCGVLLDFQRPGDGETASLVKQLVEVLPCPVGVSQHYAVDVDCPVFLSPVPPSTPLEEHLAPWSNREIWLELAMDGEVITLTEEGADTTPLPAPDPDIPGFADEKLHCHYLIDLKEDAASFTLWRTREDLEALMMDAQGLEVTRFVGLYQELYLDFDR